MLTVRTLVVHVGMPKAGSSSIQYMMHRLSPALERAGVYVPATARSWGAHQSLVLPPGHWRHRPHLGGWADLEREVRRCSAPLCVISSEHFTGSLEGFLGAGRVRAMARAARREVRVVGYVRPQYALLESIYTEDVKSGATCAPFDAYLEACTRLHRFDYDAVFRRWRKAFGIRLSVYPLEAARMPEGVVAHFLALLDARHLIPDAAALPRRNERIGAKHLEVLRLARSAMESRRFADRSVHARMLQLHRKAPAALAGNAPFRPLDAIQIRAVTAHFAAANARFAREYGVDDAGVLFREKPADAAGRPCRADWSDFDIAERRWVRQLVRDVAGVDLPANPGAGDAPEPVRNGRRVDYGLAGATRPPRPHIIVRIWRYGRQLLAHMRSMRRPSDLAALLHWLAWEIKWRRARRAASLDLGLHDSQSVA